MTRGFLRTSKRWLHHGPSTRTSKGSMVTRQSSTASLNTRSYHFPNDFQTRQGTHSTDCRNFQAAENSIKSQDISIGLPLTHGAQNNHLASVTSAKKTWLFQDTLQFITEKLRYNDRSQWCPQL